MRVPRNHPSRAVGVRAFSLLEMTLVIAIVAILASIAVPRYDRALGRHRVNMAVRRIEMDFALARERAMSLSASQTVVFNVDPNASSYHIDGMADPDRPSNIYTIRLDRDPYRVSIVSANFGGDASIVFNGYGMSDSDGIVTLESGGHSGLVKISSPLVGVAVE